MARLDKEAADQEWYREKHASGGANRLQDIRTKLSHGLKPKSLFGALRGAKSTGLGKKIAFFSDCKQKVVAYLVLAFDSPTLENCGLQP